MPEEVEGGCPLHTFIQYKDTAERRGLQLKMHPHPIPGFPNGVNLYEYRGHKMIRWLCFLKETPSECKCRAETVPAAWKPTNI